MLPTAGAYRGWETPIATMACTALPPQTKLSSTRLHHGHLQRPARMADDLYFCPLARHDQPGITGIHMDQG